VNPQFYAAFADGFQSASECACQFRVGPGAKEAVFSHHPGFKISGGFGANAQFAAAVSDGKDRAPQEQRDLTIGTSAQDPVVFRPPEFAFRIEGRDALVEPSCGNGVVTALQPAASFWSGMVPNKAFSSGVQGARSRAGCALPTVTRLAVVIFFRFGMVPVDG
jgi:hypothetical protein